MAKSSTIPKVAVITRTKNRPHFLARAVNSVLKQTYTDYIQVILNDGGDRKTVEETLEAHPSEQRVVIHNKKSVGLAAALNQAISAVKSEYVCILDDDDAWHEKRLELGIEVMNQRSAAASIVPMEIVIEDIDEHGRPLELERHPHPESWSGEVSLFKQAHRNYLSNGVIMYSRQLYDTLGGYDETLLTAEDWDFGIRLMLESDVEQVVSNAPLVHYHQRPKVRDVELGNSVHAGVREQERTIMKIRNRYLRNDIKSGNFGIGYIMNDIEQGLINVTRLEGHVNRQTDMQTETLMNEIATSTDRVVKSTEDNSFYRALKAKFNKI